MRVPFVLVGVLLLAGCVSTSPPTPTPPALDLKVEGAALATLPDGVVASWTGNVTAAATLPTGQPDPTSAAKNEEKAFTLPRAATLVEAWVNWSDPKGHVGFLVVNDTGRSWCGDQFAAGTRAHCFATFYAPRANDSSWKVRVLATGYDGAPVPVPYTAQLSVRAFDLPILGTPAPYGAAAPTQFAAPVLVSKDKHTGEPSIALTPGGTIYVSAPTGPQESLWRSKDGLAFQPIPLHGATTDPGSQFTVGGGDSDIAVFGEQTIYFADQQGGSGETVSSSHDGGATWTTQPLAAGPTAVPGAPVPVPLPVPRPGIPTSAVYSADRQWLVTAGDRTVWMGFNSAQGATVVGSVDGGRSWPLRALMQEDSCFRGNLARAPDGTLYFAGCNADGPGVGVSIDGGRTFTWHLVAKRNGETNTSFIFPAHIFVVVTTDAAGNAYVVWSDEAQSPEATKAPDGPLQGLNVWLASSTDQGASWSAPKKVNTQPGTYVEPWATGGAKGQVAVAYHGTKFAGNPEEALGEWYPIVAVTSDATAASPAWKESAMSPTLVQYGPICMRGSACGGARNLLDFFQIQADKTGAIHVAYVDGTLGGSARLSNVMYAKQSGGLGIGGPSVDKSGPAVGPLPVMP